MKKIALGFILFFLLISQSHSYIQSENEQYLSENLSLSKKISEIDIEIISFEGEEYEKYQLLSNKASLQITIEENEMKIYLLEKGLSCKDYAEGLYCVRKGGRATNEELSQIQLYKQEIQNLQDIQKAYQDRYIQLKEVYDKKLEEEREIEEQKLRAEKELKLEQEREEKAQEYFISARRKLDDGDIKSAISSYVYSCSNSPNYECYFELGNAYFLQSQSYYEKINSYGYDKLFKEQKEKAVESLGKAYNLAEDDTQRESINSFIGQIENYPNKEEKEPIKNTEENTINAKVEIIWSRIEKLTSEYSEEKKKIVYQILAERIEEHIKELVDMDLKQILALVVYRLKNY